MEIIQSDIFERGCIKDGVSAMDRHLMQQPQARGQRLWVSLHWILAG